jgi:hypothetical protein
MYHPVRSLQTPRLALTRTSARSNTERPGARPAAPHTECASAPPLTRRALHARHGDRRPPCPRRPSPDGSERSSVGPRENSGSHWDADHSHPAKITARSPDETRLYAPAATSQPRRPGAGRNARGVPRPRATSPVRSCDFSAPARVNPEKLVSKEPLRHPCQARTQAGRDQKPLGHRSPAIPPNP